MGSPQSPAATPSHTVVFEEREIQPGGVDELWIIEKSGLRERRSQATQYVIPGDAIKGEEPSHDDHPGTGTLVVNLPGEKKIPVPLKHTDVRAQISGYIATVEVTQQFHNPYDGKIEAVYVFPLPQNAAVNDFIMTIGERRIRGIIREREEAQRIYKEARRQGRVVSLFTQERPNIFTQSVANIEPGKAIDINIQYFNTLAYVDGWYEFVFPMVVGPRFNPRGSTEGVGAVPRGQHGRSGQKTEIQYLKPHERSGHDIALKVDLDAGVTIEELKSVNHRIITRNRSGSKVEVALNTDDSIPNKDFVLRYRVAGSSVKSDLLTYRDERGGFFTLVVYPPAHLQDLRRVPMEMVFVLDCSGSMSGKPLAKAKAAIERALQKLGPDDTFQIIRFANDASQLGPQPIRATRANVQKGLGYLRSLNGSGGTMMIEGIKAALDFPHDERRLRLVSFMTDGFIGNEMEILQEMQARLGESRIFSFGVGSSVNRFLLERMAKLGKGAVAYVGLNEDSTDAVDRFYERISHPAMTDIQLDWGTMGVSEVFPKKVPDLFLGRPVILTGRYVGGDNGTARLRGKVGNEEQEFSIPYRLSDTTNHKGIPSIWARSYIADLVDQSTRNDDSEIPGMIKNIALEYNLVSDYTAFVAVDSSRRTKGSYGTTVPVAVPVPEGTKYETTVGPKS